MLRRRPRRVVRLSGAGQESPLSAITESYIEIMNLVYSYPERIDSGDFAGVGELFADAVFESEGGPRLAIARNVTVCVNMDTLKPEPLPDDLRTTLTRFLSDNEIHGAPARGDGDSAPHRGG